MSEKVWPALALIKMLNGGLVFKQTEPCSPVL